MGRVSDNNIQNLTEDWGHDENTGLPFSGEAVQTFIKSYLRLVTAAAWFDPTNYVMYFFASEADRDSFINDQSQTTLPIFSCQMNFSSTLYRVNVTNYNNATNINTATNAGTLTLSTSFKVQSKSITDQEWSDLQTACYVTVLIDRGLTGTFEAITERTLYSPNTVISLDVFEYLISGTNRVKFLYEAEDGTVTSSLVYNITLAELYVELFNNYWYQPILGSDQSTQRLGGFKIAGAGSKTLHFLVYDANGNRVVDDIPVLIGTTNAYVSTPYYYNIPAGSPILSLPTGVYTIKVYVSTAALSSEVIEYNVMLVAAADESTAQLVCINEVADKVFNYSSAVLGKFAVYNAGASSANVNILYKQMHGSEVVSSTTRHLSGIATGIPQTVGYEALWAGIEGDGYFIGFTVSLGEASASATVPLDNSTVFPPTTGYDFYMLCANRSNGEASATREAFINIADDSVLPAIWTDVDFINNIDGWTTDDEGRNCLRIPAGTSVELPISSFNLLSGDNCTIEICYKAANCSDYDEPIITISPNPSAAGFKGIRIKPTNITIHSSSDTGADKDTLQGTNLCDEEPVHFVLTINPYYEGNNKLVKGYVNGCKNFLFEYTSSTQWAGFDGSITIGAARTDVFVYFIRHYPVALSDAAVQTNYINSLASVSEREDMDSLFASVLDAGATNIDYEAVKNNGYNFFVIQMTQGNGVPSAANGWGKKTEGLSILEMHFGAHPEWDWKIENPETMGQGTTSMNYYRWNIRWRIDKANKGTANEKKVPVSYVTERTKVGGSYQYTWGEASWSKTVRFDGTAHPPVMRITAKINQASSMQSHKIGATRAYDELHKAIGLENEAQAAARLGNTPIPTVAVYEYPAFGFEYDAYSNTYTFIGLFTIGPDKGDKPTFGYDAVKSSLITLEGTDHSQPTAKFAYPWIESNPVGAKGDVAYYYNEEGIGINLGEGSYLTGLEISNCHGREIDKDNGAADQDAVRAILDTEFKPAYLLAWENSTLIFPITTDHPYYDRDVAHTLENINSHLSGETYAVNFRLGQYNSRLGYADMQFWIEGDASYTLYYFDEAFGLYKPDISLSQQLGTPSGATATEKNEWFKEQRRARFKADAADYWDLDECLYHFAFCLLIGATDNFAKNSYPYKMATIAGGGRWRWRQDDLDTIFDTDNSGRDSKPYQIEYEDAINNTPYFAGSNSVFWNLINECYWDDYNNGAGRGIRTIGRNIINQMTRLSQSNNPYDGFVRYITKCFWGNAQDYFPVSAYNVDCVFKYEQAWLVNGQNVPPLTQALGNHYSGERLWVRRRAVYILSLFRYGPFGDYSDTNLGTISFRPNSLTVSLSPILWMYPALAVGQNNVVTGGRTQPGAVCVLSQSSDGNTAFYIQASNYFTSLGSLKGLRLGQQDIGNITITAAKLIQLIAGSVTAGEVTTNIPGFELSQKTKCLEVIDLRNASSITALNGLANCTRLRSLLLSGTNIPSVDVPTGSKVENLSLPGALQRLVLLSLKHLSSFSIASYASIITLHIEDTAYDAMAILLAAYNGSSVLRYIRLIWSGEYLPGGNADNIADMLSALAAGNYEGLAADGSTTLPKPFIEGIIYTTGMNTDSYYELAITSEEALGDGRISGLSSLFNTQLKIYYRLNEVYIRFKDAAVEAICLANYDTSGDDRISLSEAKARTGELAASSPFSANTTIQYFNELKYFNFTSFANGNDTNGNGCFSGCSALKEITLPPNLTQIGWSAFKSCSSLEKVVFPERAVVINRSAFNGCSSLVDIGRPIISSFGGYTAFSGCSALVTLDLSRSTFTTTYNPTAASNGTFRNCTGLKTAILPTTCTILGAGTFQNCSNLESINWDNIVTIATYSVLGCGKLGGELTLPKCTSIATQTFSSKKYTKIVMPAIVSLYGTSTNGNGVFYNNTLLTYVDIGPNCTNIGDNSFRGCSALATLIVRATTPPTLAGSSLAGTPSTQKIYVPYSEDHSILAAYQAATNWSSLSSRLLELDENGEIPE